MLQKKTAHDAIITTGYHLTRLIMAGVFIYASIDKIIHPDLFAKAVYNYQVLPGYLVNLTSLFLPWLELVLGTCLLINRWLAGASVMAAVLMALFVGMILFNLARGLDIGCGCFSIGPGDDPVTLLTLVRDMVLLCLAWFLACLTYYKNICSRQPA